MSMDHALRGNGGTITDRQNAALAANREHAVAELAKAGDRKVTPEVVRHAERLRDEGHGPQRHLDPTDEQLLARWGDSAVDPATGKPKLDDKGAVEGHNKVDPMGRDGVHDDRPDLRSSLYNGGPVGVEKVRKAFRELLTDREINPSRLQAASADARRLVRVPSYGDVQGVSPHEFSDSR
jgi:hypothetical protein